jgi:glycosyltransferase involved in cell wall biosynthesis
LAAGRFIEKKGFSVLLKALAILRSRGAAISLTLAGDGPLRTGLAEETDSLGLADLVTFPGFLPEESLRDRMAAAALLVCPSVIASDGDREGIPNVLLEAMALRVPVVAASVGGISEAIRDGQDGLLVAQGDPHALADRIQEALCRPEDARRRAESARQRVCERHHPDAISAQLLDLFNGIGEVIDGH